MPDPLVIQVLKAHRSALESMDSRVMDDMGARWLSMEKGLQGDIVELAREMDRRKSKGENITVQMIRKAESYQQLKVQIDDEIAKYNTKFAAPYISKTQEQYASIGIKSAQDAITASYQDAGFLRSFGKINVGAVQSMIGFAGDGSPLIDLLKKDYPMTTNAVVDSLVNGLARGSNPAKMATDMVSSMGIGLDRGLLIARTEASRSYRTGSSQQYRHSGVTAGFKRLVRKETACLGCLILDGERFTSESELDDHPNGKCMAVPIVEGVDDPAWETGQEWLAKQDPERQIQILGQNKYDLWKGGLISLNDMADKTRSSVWGDSPKPTAYLDLLHRSYPGVSFVFVKGHKPLQKGDTYVQGAPENIAGAAVVGTPPKPVVALTSIPIDTTKIKDTKSKDVVSQGFNSINDVMKLPPSVKIVMTPMIEVTGLKASCSLGTENTSYIKISKDATPFIVVHETGHAVLNSVLGEKVLSWKELAKAPDGFQLFSKVIMDTDYWKELSKKDGGLASYLKSPEEVFARAYSQYVAEKSGSIDVLSEKGWQWTTKDFAPVSKELDSVFSKLGWLKKVEVLPPPPPVKISTKATLLSEKVAEQDAAKVANVEWYSAYKAKEAAVKAAKKAGTFVEPKPEDFVPVGATMEDMKNYLLGKGWNVPGVAKPDSKAVFKFSMAESNLALQNEPQMVSKHAGSGSTSTSILNVGKLTVTEILPSGQTETRDYADYTTLEGKSPKLAKGYSVYKDYYIQDTAAKKSIKLYTNESSEEFNDRLRRNPEPKFITYTDSKGKEVIHEIDSQAKIDIANIQHAFDNGPRLPENVRLYRTCEYGPWEDAVKNGTMKPGTILQDKGFMSTTIDPTIGFLSGAKVLLEILADEGTKALWVEPISMSKGEKEVVLPPNANLEVISSRYDSDRKRTVIRVRYKN